MILGIKKWFKKHKKEVDLTDISCKNCNTLFNGKFCPECGQAVRDYDKPISFIFYNFLGDFFSFDTRFFRTFLALLLRPGYLTSEFFDGKRVRYAPPIRIFIFASFILFLLLQFYTNKGLTKALTTSFSESGLQNLDSALFEGSDPILVPLSQNTDSLSLVKTDSILGLYGITRDTSPSENLDLRINMETFRDTRNMRQALDKLATHLEKQLEIEEDPDRRLKIQEYLYLCRSPEQATSRILEYLSWAFFLLLPVFALILKLAYVRRKQRYMRHLIFSIHMHSFIFLIFTIVTLLYILIQVDIEPITAILLLTVPVYFIFALKRFYGQSYFKVFLKFLMVSFIYNFILLFALGFVFLDALRII